MQFLDQGPLVNSTGAGYIEVQRPDYAESATRQAFYRARREGRPIVLSIPIDVATQACNGSGDAYVSSSHMFPGQQHIRPDVAQLEAAANIVASGKKPIILIGRGAMDGDTLQQIERLAQRIGALLTSTLHAKGAHSGEADFYTGIAGLFSTRTFIDLCGEADCVIAVGASMNNYSVLVKGKLLYPKAKIVHIDVAPHLMMGNGRGADCYVQGDGGALQNIQELDTASRLGLKLLFVVFNDEAYGAEYHKLKVKKMNDKLSAVRAPDFAKVAEGFGCKGRTAITPEQVATACDEFMHSDGPMLINVKTSRNVVSIPHQRMHLGVDI